MNDNNVSLSLDNLPKPVVRLVGSDGNAFAVLGMVSRALKQAGWNRNQVDAFQKEATSGDYNNLLFVCMKYTAVARGDEDEDDLDED